MKKFTVFLSSLACAFQMNSQVVLTENFNAPFTPNGTDWAIQNNSAPTGTLSWFQGNPNYWPAYSGPASSYYSVGYVSTSGAGVISNWLVTPTVNIYNGAVLSFATRCPGGTYPDRLQVRMSTAGTSTSVGTGTVGIGNFSNLMLDINPLYSTSTVSTVNNGTVAGYPSSWTVYNLTVTGQPVPVVGRFAFRYFVENGGPGGSNSDLIGIDAVKYELPCGATVPSYTNCAGNTTTLSPVGGLGQTTYSWSTGATTESITVNPVSTTVYTLTSLYPGGVCPNPVTTTITAGTSLGVSIVASSTALCAGNAATLTALAPATSYTWLPGSQSAPSITVNPASSQSYTLVAENASCFGAASVALVVNPNPTLTASSSNPNICINQTFTLTGSGATSYTWVTGSQSSTVNPLALSSSSVGVYTLALTGANTNGCKMTISFTQTVSACTGIEETTLNGNVTVYPNPFTSEINISGLTGSVQIYNTLGQMVVSTSINENETINTGNLAKGVYIVKAFDPKGRELKTIRIIKN